MDLEIIFLIIVLIFAILIFHFNIKRNAWDIMFYNATFAIVVLFMIGLLAGNVWKEIIYILGLVAVGSGIAGIFKQRKSK